MAATACKLVERDDPIVETIALIHQANGAVTRACARADETAARQEGRIVAQADRDTLEAAGHSYAAAIEALAACMPCTLAGVRAVLSVLAQVDPPDEAWLRDALGRLAACPALADPA